MSSCTYKSIFIPPDYIYAHVYEWVYRNFLSCGSVRNRCVYVRQGSSVMLTLFIWMEHTDHVEVLQNIWVHVLYICVCTCTFDYGKIFFLYRRFLFLCTMLVSFSYVSLLYIRYQNFIFTCSSFTKLVFEEFLPSSTGQRCFQQVREPKSLSAEFYNATWQLE